MTNIMMDRSNGGQKSTDGTTGASIFLSIYFSVRFSILIRAPTTRSGPAGNSDCSGASSRERDRLIRVNLHIPESAPTRRIPFKFASRIIRWKEGESPHDPDCRRNARFDVRTVPAIRTGQRLGFAVHSGETRARRDSPGDRKPHELLLDLGNQRRQPS